MTQQLWCCLISSYICLLALQLFSLSTKGSAKLIFAFPSSCSVCVVVIHYYHRVTVRNKIQEFRNSGMRFVHLLC